MTNRRIFLFSLAICGAGMSGCATSPDATSSAWPWPDEPTVGSYGDGGGGVGSSTGHDRVSSSPHAADPEEPARINRSPDDLVASSAATHSLVTNARERRRAGDLTGAGRALERAISLGPRDPVVWFELARLRLAEGRWSDAEITAQRALEYSLPGDDVSAWCWILIAEARDAQGDSGGADEARRQAQLRS